MRRSRLNYARETFKAGRVACKTTTGALRPSEIFDYDRATKAIAAALPMTIQQKMISPKFPLLSLSTEVNATLVWEFHICGKTPAKM
jgi:hypothetical protein